MLDDAPTSEWLKRGKSLDTSSEEDKSCTGEGSWYDKCKQCHCEGGVTSCTDTSCEDGFSPLHGTCKGKVGFNIDCNACFCDKGYAVCTLIYCPAFVGGLH